MVDFTEISEADWQTYPEPTSPKPPNRWDEMLGVIDSGKIVVIDVPAEKLRGTRIGIARSASTRGFKVEFRYQDGRLAMRRSEKPLASKEARDSPEGQDGGQTPRKTRRSRKTSAGSQE